MGDPVSIALIASSVVGAGTAAYSASEQQRAQKKAAKAMQKTPPAPPPTPEALPNLMADNLQKRRRGRAETILTGDLEPMDLGKKTLLG
jgi:hypothetical protein